MRRWAAWGVIGSLNVPPAWLHWCTALAFGLLHAPLGLSQLMQKFSPGQARQKRSGTSFPLSLAGCVRRAHASCTCERAGIRVSCPTKHRCCVARLNWNGNQTNAKKRSCMILAWGRGDRLCRYEPGWARHGTNHALGDAVCLDASLAKLGMIRWSPRLVLHLEVLLRCIAVTVTA
jgi:hypothetical protein